MPSALRSLGAMTAMLAFWVFACDGNNEFLFVLLPVALVLLGAGLVME